MEEQKEESNKPVRGVTEGGYDYLELESGNKVRGSIVQRRIIEDNETFEEYRLRLKLVKNMEKTKKPRIIWDSYNWGTLTAERAKEVYEAMLKHQENK